MKKTTKILSAASSAVLVLGLMALPALASGSPLNSASGWFPQMRNYMSRAFTPAQHQQLMNSSAMQSLHNSSAMRQAMQSGNIGKMQSLMNSDAALKAQIGQANINKMNGFMDRARTETGAPGQSTVSPQSVAPVGPMAPLHPVASTQTTMMRQSSPASGSTFGMGSSPFSVK